MDHGTDPSHLHKSLLRPGELPSEAKQRLQTLVDTKKTREGTFLQRRKKDSCFDVNRFLTEPSPQQEEAVFIIHSFQDPPCLQFKPQPHSANNRQNCSMCGQTLDFHQRLSDEQDGGHQAPQNDVAIKQPRQAFTSSIAAAVAATGDATDKGHHPPKHDFVDDARKAISRPARTFGSVQIPMRFVGHSSSSTKENYLRKYLKFDANDDATDLAVSRLWALMTDIWKIKVPSVVFSVTGGEIPDKYLKAMNTVATAIKKITSQTGCWIITDGRNYGTSKYLGKMLQPEDSKDSQRQQYSPVFVCATHWGSLHRKELLFGINFQLPREFQSSQYFYSMEYKLFQEENGRVLNPYQAVYLLLDNGLSEAGDCPLRFKRKFEQFIKETDAKQIHSLEEMTLPVVTLVIGGDDQTLNQVLHSVEQKNPVIVVNKSGAIPSLLSELFYNLEDAHPRTRNEETGWTDHETATFTFYMDKNDKNLRRIWNCYTGKNAQETTRKNVELKNIQTTIRKIMENRYYVTVIDSSFENEESLHCSILQGIYKGYSNGNGMAIALKTGTYDFIQALFLGEVDPQFTKGPYITVHALNCFYRENLRSGLSISKVLRLMRKRESNKEEVDSEKSILPVVGRILHLLLGARYKVMYQEAKYADLGHGENSPNNRCFGSTSQKKCISNVTADMNFEQKEEEEQLWHLFLWSVLAAKPDMTQFFLIQTSAPLGASLLAFKLYSKLAFYSHKVYEEELADTLSSAADHFQVVAIQILNNMYNTDADEAYRVLISELPFDFGPYVTPLNIADDSQAMDFMKHSCCQTYLHKVWKGNMAVETPFWKSLPLLPSFVAIPLIHFDGSPLKHLEIECSKVEPRRQTFWKVQSYYTAPITKFFARMFAYMCFLALLSYYVLTDLKTFNSFAEITVSEWFVIVWELTLIVDEMVQLATISDVGPTFDLVDFKLSNAIWHHYEKLRMDLYIIELYLRSGRWNSVDLSIVVMFIVSFALRFSLPLEMFQMARIFFAVTVIVCYFRLLRFWYVLSNLGPRIIAIQMMLTELVKFIIVLALFVVSFGIAFQAILNPNQTPSWTTFGDILYRPYWEMFGELFLDRDNGMVLGRPISDLSCYSVANKSMYATGTGIICYEWAALVLLGIYLLISSVLLLNLLVAIFSKSYESIDAKSRKVWVFNLYSLIQESFYNEWLPPPLSILAHLYRCILTIVKRCKGEKAHEEEDWFRLNPLPSSHELQKQASKGVRMYAKDERDVHAPANMETFEEAFKTTMEKLVREQVNSAMKTDEESVAGLKRENEQLKERIAELENYSTADNLTVHKISEMAAAQGTSGQGADDREPMKKPASKTTQEAKKEFLSRNNIGERLIRLY